MAGISSRQGAHHVAQKLIRTIWPRRSLRFISSPSIVCKLKSGASAPTSGAGAEKKAGAPEQAAKRLSTKEEKIRINCLIPARQRRRAQQRLSRYRAATSR